MIDFSFSATLANPITLLFIFFFAFFIFIGAFIYSKNTKSVENQFFLILCLSFAFVCFGETYFSWSPFKVDAYFFHAVSSIGFFTFWPLSIHFFLLMRDKVIKLRWKLFLLCCYIFAAFIIVTVFMGITVSIDYIRDTYTWIDVISDNLIYNRIYLPFVFPVEVFLSFYVVFNTLYHAKKSKNIIKVKQYYIIAITGLVFFVIGISYAVVFPLLKLNLPALGHFSTGFWIIAVGYSITKYKFLVPTLEYAAKEVFKIAGEMTILTDNDLNITEVNDACLAVLGYSKNELLALNVANVIVDKNALNVDRNNVESSVITKQNKKIFVNVKTSNIYNNNIKIGTIFVLADITALKNQNEKLEEMVKERTKELVAAKDDIEKQLVIMEKYTRRSIVDVIKSGKDPTILEPENRNIIALFADIRNFTNISEKLTPRETVLLLNSYFDEMNNCIISNKGEIDKLIGDCVMALFKDPDDSVKAAITMRKKLKKFNEKQSIIREPINNGIGINYGEVTMGNIGSIDKMDYTIIGDVVNAASRIEELTKYYGLPLLVSAELKNVLKNEYHTRFIDRVLIKGKDSPTTIYEIFDHNEADMSNLKKSYQKQLDQAFNYYEAGNFEKALEIYQELLRLYANVDPLINFYTERCQNLLQQQKNRLLEDWDGVYRFLTK